MSCFIYLLGVVALLSVPSRAAERKFDWSEMPANEPPSNCVSTVAGEGKPGTWKVLLEDFPLPLAPLTPGAPATMKKAVVAQVAADTTDEHFPMLVLGKETYGDFTLKTRFKIVDGLTEQMAGIAFRMQDEKNFFVVRASALGSNLLFYKFEKGLRYPPVGVKMNVKRGVWHELTLECAGTGIHILFDGKEAMPELHDPTFSAGKIAYWTKSDSISYFADTSIRYVSREPFAQQMVRDIMKEYPRLLGVQVYALAPQSKEARLIASNDEKQNGKTGGKNEADVIDHGTVYYGKEKQQISVVMPLRDRNGDVEAAVRVVMKSFPGQTEENAIIRATPIIKEMQERAAAVNSISD